MNRRAAIRTLGAAVAVVAFEGLNRRWLPAAHAEDGVPLQQLKTQFDPDGVVGSDLAMF